MNLGLVSRLHPNLWNNALLVSRHHGSLEHTDSDPLELGVFRRGDSAG